MTATEPTGSLRDWLLANDKTGHLQAIVDADAADLAAGVEWGVYDGNRFVESAPARYLAEAARDDIADACNRPVSDYAIRPVDKEEA